MKSVFDKKSVLKDFEIAYLSREISYVARKEVFSGKAKFAILGDGKEVAQVAMAKAFKKGDWKAGYYRDQTVMLALNETSTAAFFAQLYGHTDINFDSNSSGRMMNSHYASRLINPEGKWRNQTDHYNTSADVSCTAGQIPRLIGLGYASKLYRLNKALHSNTKFSNKGNEITFGTIGNASTSEGHFWEGMNAAGVEQIPIIMAIWDDDYGISVPKEFHTVKENISKAMQGFQRTKKDPKGFEIRVVKGWDYPSLVQVFQEAASLCRKEHVPFLIHVTEMTQPFGHSTSGSHERYKDKKRLQWEKDFDPIKKMEEWIIHAKIATNDELDVLKKKIKEQVLKDKNLAFKNYNESKKKEFNQVIYFLEKLEKESNFGTLISKIKNKLLGILTPLKLDPIIAIKKSLRLTRFENLKIRAEIQDWLKITHQKYFNEYNANLYNQQENNARAVKVIPAKYSKNSPLVDASHVIRACFKAALERNPLLFTMGEDVGKIGGVNQELAGLQDIFGTLRVMDTSIRETTIIGQGIGTALRGLRPIVEIQYLDYILYAIEVLSDDLSTLNYRTNGGQQAPLIIRTRGHRLEGIWHSGSPMSMLLGAIRGIHLLVPRNMVQASGMYNTLLQSGDPGIVIEVLRGYRLKERIPDNIGEFTVPLGKVEYLQKGSDITIVTYGAMCEIVMDATKMLADTGVSCEVIDVQTLLPFDVEHEITRSIKKTNRVVFADEDVPNGGSAYMMGEVLDKQDAYNYLDSKPKLISSWANRPSYGSDGDYFSKPNADDIFERVYIVMHESNPNKYPAIF